MSHNRQLFALLIATLLFQACVTNEELDWYGCVSAPAPADPAPMAETSLQNIASENPMLFPNSLLLWGVDFDQYNLHYPRKIPVCWDETAYARPEYDAYRAAAQKGVDLTWNRALDVPGVPEEKKFAFVGWDKCTGNDYEVRIAIDDVRSFAAHLGRRTSTHDTGGLPGVTLNFEYRKYNKNCATRKQYCIRLVAAHEFGHVLGLAHEQARPDTDRTVCKDAPAGNSGNVMIGAWDKNSIMNYCSDEWINEGNLTQTDVWGIQRLYYPEYFSSACPLSVTPVQ